MREALLWRKKTKDKVQCLTCSHYCTLKNGQRGICGVRQHIDGKVYSLVYGKLSSLQIDPIEKKPLYHFKPGTGILSLGSWGCNFNCLFCQNSGISQLDKEGEIKGEEINSKQIIDLAEKENLASIAYTYNEPTVFFDFSLAIAKQAHIKGIKNVYITNGFFSPEVFEKIEPFLDAANIDLKSFSDDFYRRICGGKLTPVLENIKRLWDAGVWIELTTLIIPGENDSQEELVKIANFIADIDQSIPWHISRFYPCYRMQDKISTPFDKMEEAYQIGKQAGLKYVYLGNIHNIERGKTKCSYCGEILIARKGYQIEKYYEKRENKAFCPQCKKQIELVL